jgi:hypothetical protein
MIKLIFFTIIIITFSSTSFADTIYLECKIGKDGKDLSAEVSIDENNNSLYLFVGQHDKSLSFSKLSNSMYKFSATFYSGIIYGEHSLQRKGKKREMLVSIDRHDLSFNMANFSMLNGKMQKRESFEGKCKKVNKDSAI